ncbi:phytoene/squalene synthase family protein [Amycolatopsis sp. cg5]|uniref:phytoene/squalene synthase family protein n=1 Tax=Amycolatopsis sp. cg5 TaxID=3238802 RepID=UPI0035233FDA
MNERELQAAGIHGPELRQAYLHCSGLLEAQAKARGSGTQIRFMFPVEKRPYFEVFFAFITYLDDIVDVRDHSIEVRAKRLDEWETLFSAALKDELPGKPSSRDEESDAALARAFVHLMRTWELPLDEVPAWLEAQRTALLTTEYQTAEDLESFIDTVTLMPAYWANPMLGAIGADADEACRHATTSFQLIDFMWDLREDLNVGRLYLPLDHLARFDLDRETVETQLGTGRISPALRALMAFEAKIAREHLEQGRAWPGKLHRTSRTFVDWELAANEMRLEEMEKCDFEHLSPRFKPSTSFKAGVLKRTFGDIARAIRINRTTQRDRLPRPVG